MATELDHYFENALDNEVDHYFENALNADVTHSGLPTEFSVIHGGLENIRIKEIPTIRLESNSEFNGNMELTSHSNVEMTSTNNIHIKEIPEVRAHLPMNFNFGAKLFGIEFLVFSLCGELQLINEKYLPHRSEQCEDLMD